MNKIVLALTLLATATTATAQVTTCKTDYAGVTRCVTKPDMSDPKNYLPQRPLPTPQNNYNQPYGNPPPSGSQLNEQAKRDLRQKLCMQGNYDYC